MRNKTYEEENMLCKDIIEVIEQKYARTYAMSWDNVGLLAGRYEKEVKKIYVALDATDDIVDEAIASGADMLVTHHPLIMSGLTKITDDNFTGRRLIKLIQNDISYYAMHTNYDVRGMADLAGEKMGLVNAEVLEVTGESVCQVKEEGIGRVADAKAPMSLLECCELVKNSFALDNVKVFGNPEQNVQRIAICPGSGKSVIKTALSKGADVLVTGDIGHHDGIDAVAQNLAIIDAGHYGLEHIFIADMIKYLKDNLCDVSVTGEKVKHPFIVV